MGGKVYPVYLVLASTTFLVYRFRIELDYRIELDNRIQLEYRIQHDHRVELEYRYRTRLSYVCDSNIASSSNVVSNSIIVSNSNIVSNSIVVPNSIVVSNSNIVRFRALTVVLHASRTAIAPRWTNLQPQQPLLFARTHARLQDVAPSKAFHVLRKPITRRVLTILATTTMIHVRTTRRGTRKPTFECYRRQVKARQGESRQPNPNQPSPNPTNEPIQSNPTQPNQTSIKHQRQRLATLTRRDRTPAPASLLIRGHFQKHPRRQNLTLLERPSVP